MKTVILCGGKGIRLRPYTEDMPKSMMVVGDKPLIWHIMKIYSHYDFNEFILALGYKGEKIVEWCKKNCPPEWKIDFVDTGEGGTGDRLVKIKDLIDGEDFFCTYGDGLSDVNLKELLKFHQDNGLIATITVVRPQSNFGFVEMDENGQIIYFVEKPPMEKYVNGGFFVFKKIFFEYLKKMGEDGMMEKRPFEFLAKDSQMMGYKHEGFWKCMDTYADLIKLNELWSNDAKWKVWDKKS